VASIVLVSALAAGCAGSPQQKEAKFLENGKRYLLKKDYTRAMLEFQNAVRLAPEDSEAYYQLGAAFLDNGNAGDALRNLKKATELNPAHIPAQVRLAELMAASGIKEVLEEGEQRMEAVLRSSPGNVEALDALALNEFELGKWQDAEKHLQEALAKSPQSARSSVALAQLRLAKRDFKGAEEALEKAVKEAPGSVEASTGLAELYVLEGRWSEAEAQFRGALKINPQFSLALFGLATAQIQQGHKDQAGETYRVIAAGPEKQYRHVHAIFLFAEGRRDAAVKELEELLRRDSTDRAARTRLVAAYVLTNAIPKAEEILTKALKANGKDREALLQRSQILLRAGKERDAENDLAEIIRDYPDSVQAHFLLAEVYGVRGNAHLQRQELGETLRLAPGYLAARIALARNLLAANSAKTALNLVDAAPAEQRVSLALIIQRNWILLAMDQHEEARKGVIRGLAVSRDRELLLQDSILKLFQYDYQGARASVKESLKELPEDWRGLRVLAASYIGQQQPGAAVQALQEHATQYPKSAAIHQFLGEWLLSAGQPEQARVAFVTAKTDEPSSVAADLAIARLDISENKLDEARGILTNIIREHDDHLNARLWLGSVEVRSGNRPAAMKQYREVLAADPANVLALNNLAYLLADDPKQIDVALAHAQKARELSPDNADTAGTLGWVLYCKGIYGTALAQLTEASAKDGGSSTPNAAIRKYHLAMTYLKLGDRQNGMKVLQLAKNINPNLPEAKMAATLADASR
jgi:tetratricopeptide (TPR) repeat protein